MPPHHGIQVVSDIHLEFRGKWIDYEKLLPQTAIDLALCGDIGRPFLETSGMIRHYKEFLRYTGNRWRHVFVITGNHSYYGRRKEDVDECIQHYCKELSETCSGTLHFLNDSSYTYTKTDSVENFAGIYGCTLWTDVSDMAFGQMNDCRIKPKLTVDETFNRRSSKASASLIRLWHEMHKQKLKQHLAQQQSDKKWVIMTHHPPRAELDQKYSHTNAFTNSAYLNDLDNDIFDKSKIAVWLSGHLHVSVDKIIDGIRCISNCMGYPQEQHTRYTPEVYVPYCNPAVNERYA